MKKIMILAAFAAAASTSCIKDPASLQNEAKTIYFNAGAASTKAQFDSPSGDTYPVLWDDNDTDVALSVNLGTAQQVPIEISTDHKTAKFSYSTTASAPYRFIVVTPYYALRSISSGDQKVRVEIPSGQVCTDESPDRMAIVMGGLSDEVASLPDVVDVEMVHVPAYLHLSFSNVDLPAGAKVLSVNIVSAQKLSGRFYFKSDKTCELDDNSMFGTIGVKPESLDHVWAGVYPADLSNQTIGVQIVTDKGTLQKGVKFGADHAMESGKIYKFDVDMTGVIPVAPVEFTKVTNVSQLYAGDELIVVAENSDIALSNKQNENNRSGAGVSRTTDKTTIYNPTSAVEILKLEDGLKPGQWTLRATSAANPGYLYAADTDNKNNYLRTKNSVDESASWVIAINDDANKTAQITADLVDKHNLLRFNEDSNLFSCYGSTTSMLKVNLYRKNVAGTDWLNATMPGAGGRITNAAATLPVHVFGNVAWTAVVSDAEVATISKASGTGPETLTLSIMENTSTTDSRDITVTISTTASVATASYTLTVTQNKKVVPTGDAVSVYSYALTNPNIGTNGSYAGNCDITIDGIVWNATGVSNSTGYHGWRLGGQKLSGVDRCIYSKTPILHEVTKVLVSHSRMNITLNSLTLTVHASAADAASGANPIATIKKTSITAGTQDAPVTTTFEKADGTSWVGCYYRLAYNVTNTGTSNKYVEFRGLDMWGYLAY